MSRQELTPGEKAVNWAKAIGLIVGAFASGLGATWLRGEPGADLAYKKLSMEVRKIKIDLKEEHAFVNGFLDGLKLQLINKTESPPVSEPTKVVSQVSQRVLKCTDGFEIRENKCIPKLGAVSLVNPSVQQQQTLESLISKASKIRSDKEPMKANSLPDTLEQLKAQQPGG